MASGRSGTQRPKSQGGNLVPWRPGESGNPAGSARRLVELERMIREAQGPNVLPMLERLRELAMGELSEERGERVYAVLPDPLAMRLFLERVLGPPRIAAEDFDAMSEPELEAELCKVMRITVEQLRTMRETGGMVQ